MCDFCGKAFKVFQGLKNHMVLHDDSVKKAFSCSECGKAFHRKYDLNEHMKRHTKQKSEQCEYCDASYLYKGDLLKHVKKVHFGDLSYKCDKCPKAFRTIVERREHLSEHLW